MVARHGSNRTIPDVGLTLEHVACCICGNLDGTPIGVGEDFEYRTTAHSFLAVRCPHCSVVYLDPRPSLADLGVIYPDQYHAFAFDAEQFGLVHRVRSRLEARRLLRAGAGLPAAARILDVGCGDGFHLDLLRQFGPPGWQLQGVDTDGRAVEAARRRGFTVHQQAVEQAPIEAGSIDMALCIQTIEHVADPQALLNAISRLLKPGGRLYLITDNTGSPDFALAKGRHWGGYHFPRHWNLFDKASMRALASTTGLQIETLSTTTSPVNWTYSVRNLLVDWGAPRWLYRQFSLEAAPALALFTVIDLLFTAIGRGALLRVILRKPR